MAIGSPNEFLLFLGLLGAYFNMGEVITGSILRYGEMMRTTRELKEKRNSSDSIVREHQDRDFDQDYDAAHPNRQKPRKD